MTETLSERDRKCIEHLRAAEELGVTLREYARAYGIAVTRLYSGKAQLVKKGVLASKAPKPAADTDPVIDRFIAVRMEEPTAAVRASATPLLRVLHARGHVLEFGSWPPVELLAALIGGAADAAA